MKLNSNAVLLSAIAAFGAAGCAKPQNAAPVTAPAAEKKPAPAKKPEAEKAAKPEPLDDLQTEFGMRVMCVGKKGEEVRRALIPIAAPLEISFRLESESKKVAIHDGSDKMKQDPENWVDLDFTACEVQPAYHVVQPNPGNPEKRRVLDSQLAKDGLLAFDCSDADNMTGTRPGHGVTAFGIVPAQPAKGNFVHMVMAESPDGDIDSVEIPSNWTGPATLKPEAERRTPECTVRAFKP